MACWFLFIVLPHKAGTNLAPLWGEAVHYRNTAPCFHPDRYCICYSFPYCYTCTQHFIVSLTFFRTGLIQTTFYLIDNDVKSFIESEDKRIMQATLGGYCHKMIIITKDLSDQDTWV